MVAVIYARISSDKQKETSIEAQIKKCKSYAEQKGYTVLKNYIDRYKTATTDNRPQFQQMIKDSRKKTFDRVIVYKLQTDSAEYKAKSLILSHF